MFLAHIRKNWCVKACQGPKFGTNWHQLVLCHFLATKMGEKCIKTSKIAISVNCNNMNDPKNSVKSIFNMNCYSYRSWLYVHGFLGKNSKNCILGVISWNLEKRITVCGMQRLVGRILPWDLNARTDILLVIDSIFPQSSFIK